MESIGGTEILPAKDRGQSASPGQYLSIAGVGEKFFLKSYSSFSDFMLNAKKW